MSSASSIRALASSVSACKDVACVEPVRPSPECRGKAAIVRALSGKPQIFTRCMGLATSVRMIAGEW